jgi:hypothetical protein
MTGFFRSFELLLASLLAVSMLAGCGGDDDIDEPVPVNFVSATPTGGVIGPNVWITVTFDNPPTDVTVSAGTVTVTGKTATVAGPFTPGPLPLTIRWTDGTQRLIFTVRGPCCSAPAITGGTVEDGDTDVDPELINSDGQIVIQFSEDVTGNIVLQTEGGDDVGWLGKIEGHKGTLELVKGRELVNETVYVIFGKVSTIEGNATNFKVTFVTRGKA